MGLIKLDFKPGINRELTSYAEEGHWYDCDKIRFRQGRPEKIGGWVKATTALFKGVCRTLFNWTLLDAKDCLFIGTSKKAYIEYTGTFNDITPIRFTETKANPITTGSAGSFIQTYTTTAAHGASVGDFVTISGASAVDGIPAGDLNQEFEILTVPTTTTFTFRTATAASVGGVTGGGATVTAAFQVSIGLTYNITGGGWGTGTWSRQTWGSPINSTVSGINSRVWGVDNFGEDLIFCLRDGPLFYWDATGGLTTRATYVKDNMSASDVPDQVSIVKVTSERHVVAIGATDTATTIFDPLLIRWSSSEDPYNWTPAITNTAGFQRIPTGSYVVAAVKARQELLIWTDVSLHSLQYTGAPFTFSLQTIDENCNIAGPNAVANANNVTYWMGKNRFWMYSGRAQNLPCTVQRYVFDNINYEELGQVHTSVNENFTEVTWYYCSADSIQIDRYVTYNYVDNLWTYGSLARTAMLFCPGRGAYPYGTAGGYDSDDGTLYIHESGYDDGSTNPPSAITAYIESADFTLDSGNKILFADRLIPDLTFERSTATTPSATVSIEAKKFSGDGILATDNRSIVKTATVTQYTPQVWVRIRGRQMRFKITSTGTGVCWLLGSVRLNVRQDGVQ